MEQLQKIRILKDKHDIAYEEYMRYPKEDGTGRSKELWEQYKIIEKELNVALLERYPFLQVRNFLKNSMPEDYNYILFKDDIPFGWWKRWGLEFLEDLKEVLDKYGFEDYLEDKFTITQVKEKYGSLRFYSNAPEEWFEHEQAWEHISAHTCSRCGDFPVKLRDDGWICPWCDSCFEKIGPKSKELRDECTVKGDYISNIIGITTYAQDNKVTTKTIDMIPYYKLIGYEWGENKNDLERRKDNIN